MRILVSLHWDVMESDEIIRQGSGPAQGAE